MRPRQRQTLFALLLTVAVLSAACAAKTTRARAEVGALGATQAVVIIDTLEAQATQTKAINDGQHKAANAAILKLAEAVQTYVRAVQAWRGENEVATARAAALKTIEELDKVWTNPAVQAATATIRTLLTGATS